ncbi:fimbrillin family protein [uncultured Bacteroides sp.]|uniref:fimbrillin family protein n=1 Tax=uncultured Bacteroides sp. TaxID=162156 RepID=UPI0025F61E94|nr:fimbrillin family protein [uncultured Bacteroides sp.]
MKAKYLMIATVATMLAACSNDENEVNNGPVEARITAGVSGPSTRAVDDKWKTSDNIGVRVESVTGTTAGIDSKMADSYKNVKYTASTLTNDDKTATFTPATTGAGIFFQDANETVTFTAYAPYQESAANALPGTEGDGVIDVNTDGSIDNTQAGSQEKIDFLFASGATASKSSPAVTFADKTSELNGTDCSFKHKMARLKLVLKVSTSDGFVAGDMVKTGNTFKLSGLKHEGTFNVTTGVTSVTSTNATSDWEITSFKHTDAENVRTYSLILLPQDVSQNGLKLAITIDEQVYTTKDNAIKPNLEAGKSYSYEITAKKQGLKVEGCTITPWVSNTTTGGNATMGGVDIL